MAAMPEVVINVLTLEGAAFKLTSGDTLVVTSPRPLTMEQREKITIGMRASIPEGVKVIVLDGGLTVSAITKA